MRRALLDDGYVARRVPNDLVDRRAEDGRLGARPGRGGLAAPAEDDQLRVELGRRLDHAFRGAPPDADDGVDRHSLGRVVEDALQQPAGLPGLGGALAERRSLGHLHDPEHGQAAALAVEQGRADPDQLLGGQRVGDGDQDSRGERRARHSAGRFRAGAAGLRRLGPVLDEIWLEQLELSSLALNPLLGLVGGQAPVLDHEAADAPEVDRHERCHQPLGGHLAEAGRNQQVVEDAGPQVVREVEARNEVRQLVGGRQPAAAGGALAGLGGEAELPRRGLGHGPGLPGQLDHALVVVRPEHPSPGVGDRQRPGVELAQQAQRVDLQGRRIGVPLEAVRRYLVAAGDLQPAIGVVPGHAQQRPHDLAEHRAQVGPGILGVVDLRPEAALADGEAAGQRGRRHPDVDAEARYVRRPGLLGEVVADQVAADAEVAADRLADAVAVQCPRHGIGDGVGDGAVVLVAGVERRHEVVAALEDRPGQQLDPFRDDRAQVRIHDHQGPDVERGGHLEDGPQGGSLAAHAVEVGIGQADPIQPVLRVDEQDLLDVSRRLGLHDHPLRSVRGARVGVHQDGAKIREVLDQAGLGSPNHVADRGRVPIARDADHDVGTAEPRDLIPDGRRQRTRRHPVHRTTPPDRPTSPGPKPRVAVGGLIGLSGI